MRSRRATALAALAAAAAPLTAVAATGGGGGQARASAAPHAAATAFAGSAGRRGSVAVSGAGRRSVSVALTGDRLRGRATATASAGGRGAAADVRAAGVSVFDGLVTASSVAWRASARDGRGAAGGSIAGLVVAGEQLGGLEGSARFSAGGYGTVIALEDSGLRVVLSKPYHGYPAGAVATIGQATASAPAAPRPPAPPARTTTAIAPVPVHPVHRARVHRRPRAHRAAPPQAKVRRVRPHPQPKLTDSHYSFPVLSRFATPCDCFGAAREIGAHQGDDIFAPFGTPVVAVHAGRLNRVGTLPIAGNRLWVKTASGDSFFYAHLSAFSPAAVDGHWVKAGTVLGYVGNTGDAEPTPPHLHFEIHPHDGAAVDPYAFLTAWRAERDVARGAWDQVTSARPGTLVQIRDDLAR